MGHCRLTDRVNSFNMRKTVSVFIKGCKSKSYLKILIKCSVLYLNGRLSNWGHQEVPRGLSKNQASPERERQREEGRVGEKDEAKLLKPGSTDSPITRLRRLINNARLLLFSLLSHYHSCKNHTVNTVSSRGERRGKCVTTSSICFWNPHSTSPSFSGTRFVRYSRLKEMTGIKVKSK